MSELFIDFNTFDMILSVSINGKEETNYKIKMEYSYIDEKKVIDEESLAVSEEYIFAYSIDELGVHTKNGQPFKLSSMEEKNILNVLNKMMIVKTEDERELLKAEFNQLFFLLVDDVNQDFKDSLLFCDIY